MPIYRHMAFISKLECTQCNRTYNPKIYVKTCPNCNGILHITYDLDKIREEISLNDLERRTPGVWKYFEFLPVFDKSNIVSLGEGGTFLHKCDRLAKRLGLQELYLKDETTNPTGAFIDRGTTVEISKAKEFKVESIYCGLTANLVASVVAYTARAGLKCKVFLPQRVDIGKFYQTIAYGTDVEIAKDSKEACWEAYNHAVRDRERGVFSHFVMPYNIYFLEGEKTTAYEICEQLNWTPPDRIIVPMGSGGHLSMTWKGINELYQIGFIQNRNVKIVGTQAEGCAPIVETFKRGANKIIPADSISTIALDISVKEPPCGLLALNAIRESKGTAISVSDKEIIEAVGFLAKLEGIFAEPASATTIACLKKLVEAGEIDSSEKIVCIITGMGLKYPEITRNLVKGSKKLEALLRRVEKRKYTTRLGETKLSILQILSRKELYGYEIWKVLKKKFRVKLKIPTVYQHLAELENMDLIVRSRSEQVFGKIKRNYYRLTEKGRTVLVQLKKLTT